jgi:hypothetical protein
LRGQVSPFSEDERVARLGVDPGVISTLSKKHQRIQLHLAERVGFKPTVRDKPRLGIAGPSLNWVLMAFKNLRPTMLVALVAKSKHPLKHSKINHLNAKFDTGQGYHAKNISNNNNF